jgi:hypothetical protein
MKEKSESSMIPRLFVLSNQKNVFLSTEMGRQAGGMVFFLVGGGEQVFALDMLSQR